jgi:hypothetical protein
LLLLIAGSLAFWLLVAIPARHWWGDAEAVYAGVAVLLCLVPSMLTLLWTGWTTTASPEQQLIAVLGGTGLRMLVVLAGAWVLHSRVPYFQEQGGFWVWVLVAYLFTLLLEKLLLLGGRSAPHAASRS